MNTSENIYLNTVLDPVRFGQNLLEVVTELNAITKEFALKQPVQSESVHTDIAHISKAFSQALGQLASNPELLINQHMQWWRSAGALWLQETQKFLGLKHETGTEKDRRFKHPAWQQSAAFEVLKNTYRMNAQWLQETLGKVDGLDMKTAQKVAFYTRQLVDALSPSNFAATNPEVIEAMLKTNGESLLQGVRNLKRDLVRGRMSMTDEAAFTLGKNLAATKGSVVFQTELMQLIHYAPLTDTVHELPVLLIPAWINKFYILDLQPENSLVKYLLEAGHSVFVISWVNPDARMAQKSFADYVREGPVAAIRYITNTHKVQSVNAVGYCLGGTLLAILLSILAQNNQGEKIASATFLTTMLDFANAGDLAVFVDDAQLATMEQKMAQKGYLDGSDMAMTFNLLRANELIWSFVINQYLLGKEPFPFDLLYWNADSTRMPAAMHSYYLRNMYLENRLMKGEMDLDGVQVNLEHIRTPCFFLSTRDDHIAPWMSTFSGARKLAEATPVEFCLSASGHIAGVINPPAKSKYSYWTNAAALVAPKQWIETATEHNGSWWPHWLKWLNRHAGKPNIPARHPKTTLEEAPGSYCKRG